MSRFFHSVRLRLTLWYAGVLALALAVFAISVYIFVVRTLQTSIDEALHSYAVQVGQVAAPHIKAKHLDVKKLPVPNRFGKEPNAALLIMNIRGQTKAVKHGHVSPSYRQLRIT